MDLKERANAVVPESHWYYRSKRIPVLRAFQDFASRIDGRLTVVDFGAGSGFFGQALENRFPDRIEQIYLVDTAYEEGDLGPVGGSRQIKARSVPALGGPVFVLIMDVLEHVEDDCSVLNSVVEQVPPGSRFFITTPAFQALWSRHDEVLGHYRRYRLPRLQSLCLSSGLASIRSGYLFGIIFPAVFVKRRLCRGSPREHSDLTPAPAWANWSLLVICSLEMRLVRFNRWFGVTAMVEVFKPNLDEADG